MSRGRWGADELMDAEPTSMAAWRRGRESEEAFVVASGGVTALFEQEYAAMVRLAYVLVRSQDDAEEIVQDAFVEVQHRWGSLLNPGGYLRTTVVNGARRHLTRSGRRRDLELDATARDGHPGSAGGSEYLTDVLATLPEQQRTAVVLAYYAGMGPTEIAETMGCRVGTVKSWVHRGLKRLRKELDRD